MNRFKLRWVNEGINLNKYIWNNISDRHKMRRLCYFSNSLLKGSVSVFVIDHPCHYGNMPNSQHWNLSLSNQ